jgi:MerR family transcriptional regulator/heat shock protein HspR
MMEGERFHRAVYVISVAAELAGVHPQTLRIYERKGLVEPSRTGGGSRRYSDADLALLTRIQELTNEGLNLAGVKRVLELENRVAELEGQVAEAETAIGQAVKQVRREQRRDLVPVKQSITIYKRGS